MAGEDLGLIGSSGTDTLTGSNIAGGLNTTLLKSLGGGYHGGTDTQVQAGQISIDGNVVDLSAAETLQDVIDGINSISGTTNVTASVNKAGNGISLTSSTGSSFAVTDVTGNLASFLSIDGAPTNGQLNSGDLDRQFISEATSLSALNAGDGVPQGKLRIIDANGAQRVIDLTQDDDTSIGEVLKEMNAVSGGAYLARINDTGDGILIENLTGSGTIQVLEEDNGSTAEALGILGSASDGDALDGSFEIQIDIEAGDSLSDLVDKLTAAGAPVQASIINDGSGLNPVRLNLTSRNSGAAGELLIDTGDTSLSFSNITAAKDSVLLVGQASGGVTPLRVTSNSTTFEDLIPGVTLNVQSTSQTPVNITVQQDDESIVTAMQSFVDGFNTVKDLIATGRSYDADSGQAGLLFTDSATRLAENRLNAFVNSVFSGTGSGISYLGELGISFDGSGNIEFDESAFRAALQEDPDAVETFFSAEDTGFVARFDTLVEELTDLDGLITSRVDALTLTIEKQNTSLTEMEDRLDAKRDRLNNEFYSLELALADLQSQQSALTELANLASSWNTAVI